MRLTSLSLIVVSCGLTVLALAATVRFWRTARSWRPVVRITGLIAVEVLMVLSAGLIANRADDFYPSWQALTGDLAPVAKTARQAPGRLDARLATSAAEGLAWTPAGYPGWRLAAPPVLIAPAGYDKRTDRAFPVIVAFAAADQAQAVRAAARTVPDALTLIVTPGPATSAADLATLPGALAHDARVLPDGWAVVADNRYATLAGQWRGSAPGRIRTVTALDVRRPAAAVAAAARELPAPLAAPLRLSS